MRQLFLFFVIGLFSASVLFAQDAGSVDKQIKGLKGEVKKITITTDSGQVSFEGKDAKEIADRLKHKMNVQTFAFTMGDSVNGHMPKMYKNQKGMTCFVSVNGDTIQMPDFKGKNFTFNLSDDSLGQFGHLKKLGKNMIIICNGDTMHFPEALHNKNFLDMDSLQKEIQLNLKFNMKDLKECMRDLQFELKSLKAGCCDMDDLNIDEIQCDQDKTGCDSTHKDGKKMKKQIIIKKKVKHSDGTETETETRDMKNE